MLKSIGIERANLEISNIVAAFFWAQSIFLQLVLAIIWANLRGSASRTYFGEGYSLRISREAFTKGLEKASEYPGNNK